MKDFHLCVNENLGFDLCRLVTVGKTHFELLCMLVFLVANFIQFSFVGKGVM